MVKGLKPPGICSLATAACLIAMLCARPNLRAFGQNAQGAETHAEQGLKLAQAGSLAEAEEELRRAVELAPSEADYLTDLGTVQAMRGRLEESTASFTAALKLNPGDLTARQYLSANLWQLHRPQESRRNLEVVLKAKPDDRSAIFLLGMVSEELNDYAGSARLLASVPDLVRQRPESIAALARSYYHLAEKEKARRTLETLLDHPAGPQGVFLGARIAAEMRDFGTAIKLYTAIRSTYPDPAALAYNLALAQYDDQSFGEAQQTLIDVLSAGQRSGDAYDLLGWCYQKQNRTKEAIDALEQAVLLEPSKERNYSDLGKVLFDAGLFTAALRAARQAVELQPTSRDASMLEAETEFRLGQFADAIASYARAVQLDSSDPDANVGLAKAQAAAGMTEAAKATFEEGIKRFPKSAEHHLDYSLLLIGLAETGNDAARAQAEAQLKLALALDSHLPEADYQLGNLALERGQLNEAVSYLQAAGRLAPGKSKIHFALARAYRREGRKQDSAREMALYQQLKSREEEHAAVLRPAGLGHE